MTRKIIVTNAEYPTSLPSGTIMTVVSERESGFVYATVDDSRDVFRWHMAPSGFDEYTPPATKGMKLEVGKTYKLNNGEVHECTRMWGDDPLSVDEYGYGPFVIHGGCYHMNGMHGSGLCDNLNVASCVDDTDTPTLWRDMTPEEKGALLLANHEGKALQMLIGDEWFNRIGIFADNVAYRIKPEPKVKTVALCYRQDVGQVKNRIGTITLIDGKPDTASIKMEVL